jgi:hypothetical protein
VKLLIEDLYKIGPVTSLLIVAACFIVGIVASLIADARDPEAAAKQEERAHRTEAERETEDVAG